MDSVNLTLTIVSTAATVLATVITVIQFRRRPDSNASARAGDDTADLLRLPVSDSCVPTQTWEEPGKLNVAIPVRRPIVASPDSNTSTTRITRWSATWFGLLTLIPWFHFLAWAFAATKTMERKYWLISLLYGLPLLCWYVNPMLSDGEPIWIGIAGTISWLVSLIHASWTVSKLRRND